MEEHFEIDTQVEKFLNENKELVDNLIKSLNEMFSESYDHEAEEKKRELNLRKELGDEFYDFLFSPKWVFRRMFWKRHKFLRIEKRHKKITPPTNSGVNEEISKEM